MADKKVTPPLSGYPQPQPPQGPFLPAPPHQAAPQYGGGGGAYGAMLGGGGMMGVGGGVYPPAPYEPLHHHQQLPALPMYGGMNANAMAGAAAMYCAGAGYGGYIPYPVQYYPYYPLQPAVQQLRPTIMIPNGLEGSARLDSLSLGASAGLLPPAPQPPPHLLPHHQLLWR